VRCSCARWCRWRWLAIGETAEFVLARFTTLAVVNVLANVTGTLRRRAWPLPGGSVAPLREALLPPLVPVVLPQLALPVAVQVGVAVSVTPLGRLLVIVRAVAVDGPALVTSMR
jgi:hypothetical protein